MTPDTAHCPKLGLDSSLKARLGTCGVPPLALPASTGQWWPQALSYRQKSLRYKLYSFSNKLWMSQPALSPEAEAFGASSGPRACWGWA